MESFIELKNNIKAQNWRHFFDYKIEQGGMNTLISLSIDNQRKICLEFKRFGTDGDYLSFTGCFETIEASLIYIKSMELFAKDDLIAFEGALLAQKSVAV